MAPSPFIINSLRPKRGTPGPTVEISDHGITVREKFPRSAAWSELDLSRTTITAERISLRYRKDLKDPLEIWRKCYEPDLAAMISARVDGAVATP